ncbi:unnamed protein product [Notodromas monacha]|uniref:Large ribosomal subunit protein uL16m n=1 Tax=Notodromas monacha TaxID=399045 RepID=A0A7R9BKF7_9CRUS|nr:unnamed protein product [Notodromas monacha]CAG0915805.1 unnamed protein product [Notodromas monacha]
MTCVGHRLKSLLGRFEGVGYQVVRTVKTPTQPPDFSHIVLPEKRRLPFYPKVPVIPNNARPPKWQRKLEYMRGPEEHHNRLIHGQYGVQALIGGELKFGHFEMMRMTMLRKFVESRMFAVYRVDAPWKSHSSKKRRLPFYPKVPVIPNNARPPKWQRKLEYMRGPEEHHNRLIHGQYGVQALIGGELKFGHFEMMRMTMLRKFVESRMFAVYRVDAPWKSHSSKLSLKVPCFAVPPPLGNIHHYTTPVKAGRIILELAGKCEFAEVSDEFSLHFLFL